jgi:hypothetical protein
VRERERAKKTQRRYKSIKNSVLHRIDSRLPTRQFFLTFLFQTCSRFRLTNSYYIPYKLIYPSRNAPWLFYDFHHHLSSSLFVSCLLLILLRILYKNKTYNSFLKATTFTTFHTRLFFIRQGILK